MDYADKLDMMDDDCDIQGFPLEDSKPKRDGVKEINKVCKAVLRLHDSDFQEAYKMAQGQAEYSHPFKMKTAGWQHDLSNHNLAVLAALENLRTVISQGENITRP